MPCFRTVIEQVAHVSISDPIKLIAFYKNIPNLPSCDDIEDLIEVLINLTNNITLKHEASVELSSIGFLCADVQNKQWRLKLSPSTESQLGKTFALTIKYKAPPICTDVEIIL